MEEGKPENSKWNKCHAIPDDAYSKAARYKLEHALDIMANNGLQKSIKTAPALLSLARLTKVPPDRVGSVPEQKKALEAVFTYLAELVTVCEVNLGFDHPETADAYTKIGLAYKESGRYAAAAPWMRRAFSTFYKAFGGHDDLTVACYE